MNYSVYYAVDTNPLHLELVRLSIESLRYYNSEIPVWLGVFGGKSSQNPPKLRNLDIEFRFLPKVPPQMRWALKWLFLTTMVPYDRVLFLDADTLVLDDIEAIFLGNSTAKFYAQKENLRQVKPSASKLAKLRKSYGAGQCPIFNSSAMLFNQAIHREIVRGMPVLVDLIHRLNQHSEDNPLSQAWRFMAEEVASSIFLGQIEGFTYEFFANADVSQYSSVRAGDLSLGRVLHMGNAHAARCLYDFGLNPEARQIQSIYRKQDHWGLAN